MCGKHISNEILQDIFEFTYDRMRRYEGKWHLERQPLFPDYVFLESKDGEKLTRELTKFFGVNKFLSDYAPLILLDQKEELFLRDFCANTHHLGMSWGYIQDGVTFVTEGPLRGKEQLIRRIDRHKRVAQVEIPGNCRSNKCLDAEKKGHKEYGQEVSTLKQFQGLQLGLEIVAKN